MAYKSKYGKRALEALWKCKVLHPGSSGPRIVALREGQIKELGKELQIEKLELMKPAGVHAKALHAQQKAGQKVDQQIQQQQTQAAEASPQNQTQEVPPPPVQNKQQLPGEDKKAFHARRMKEGKAYKKWEKDYGAAYATLQAAQETTPVAQNVTPVMDQILPDDESLSEADTAPVDPMKEEIERQAMQDLMEKHGKA